jgi:hypothetical protein
MEHSGSLCRRQPKVLERGIRAVTGGGKVWWSSISPAVLDDKGGGEIEKGDSDREPSMFHGCLLLR